MRRHFGRPYASSYVDRATSLMSRIRLYRYQSSDTETDNAYEHMIVSSTTRHRRFRRHHSQMDVDRRESPAKEPTRLSAKKGATTANGMDWESGSSLDASPVNQPTSPCVIDADDEQSDWCEDVPNDKSDEEIRKSRLQFGRNNFSRIAALNDSSRSYVTKIQQFFNSNRLELILRNQYAPISLRRLGIQDKVDLIRRGRGVIVLRKKNVSPQKSTSDESYQKTPEQRCNNANNQ